MRNYIIKKFNISINEKLRVNYDLRYRYISLHNLKMKRSFRKEVINLILFEKRNIFSSLPKLSEYEENT